LKKELLGLGLLMLVGFLFVSFSSIPVYGDTYILRGSLDNSVYHNQSLPPQLNVSGYFEAGEHFFFNFTKGRFWGCQYDVSNGGLEPANPEFAPGIAIPPYKTVDFDLYTPSGDVVVTEVYVVAGAAPFAVVYFNESADFSPLPGGNLTFTDGGMEGTINRTGNYTVKATAINPLVLRDSSHTYDITSDPPTLMSLYAIMPTNYSVTFMESGLPSGVVWWVDLKGDNRSSTSNVIDFSLPNGTYSYSTGAFGYNVSPSTASVTVNGANISQEETFTVVPEFPSFIILPAFMVVTLLVAIISRRKPHFDKTSAKQL
jgi:hypothetical protein